MATALFLDHEFPPTDNSLGPDLCKKGITWRRAPEATGAQGETDLFRGGIDPSDIKQGMLGDCWLLSSIAAMAEFEHVVKNCFVTKHVNSEGKYTVRIFEPFVQTAARAQASKRRNFGKQRDAEFKGKWYEVTVDDMIPCDSSGAPAFAKGVDGEFWVCILEKAYAKFCGSYSLLGLGGLPALAMTSLTGMPSYRYMFGKLPGAPAAIEVDFSSLTVRMVANNPSACRVRKTAVSFDVDGLWAFLQKCDNDDNLMVLGTSGEDTKSGAAGRANDSNGEGSGLLDGHAYSLIAVKEAAGFRLCHVRNPWGDFEWNGEWSDRSPLWRKFPEVAQACGRGAGLDDANDGLFWMPLEKVLEMFEGVTVCYLQKAALRSGFDPTFGGHANNVTLASPRGAQGGGALGGGAQPTAAPKQASSQVGAGMRAGVRQLQRPPAATAPVPVACGAGRGAVRAETLAAPRAKFVSHSTQAATALSQQASFENPDIFAPPEVSVRPRAAAHLAAAQRVGNGGEAYQHPTAHGRRTDAHLNHNVLDSNNNRASAAGIQAGGSRLPHAPPSYARKGSVSGSERDPFSPMHEQSLTAHKRQLEERAAEYPEPAVRLPELIALETRFRLVTAAINDTVQELAEVTDLRQQHEAVLVPLAQALSAAQQEGRTMPVMDEEAKELRQRVMDHEKNLSLVNAECEDLQSVVNALRFEQRVKQEVEREATMLPREAVLAIDAMSDDQATYKVHETMQIIAELKKSLDGANTVKSELLQGFQALAEREAELAQKEADDARTFKLTSASQAPSTNQPPRDVHTTAGSKGTMPTMFYVTKGVPVYDDAIGIAG